MNPGTIHGQAGWLVLEGHGAVVQEGLAASGSQSLRLTSSSVVRPISSDGTKVWVRFAAWLDEDPAEAPEVMGKKASVVFYVAPNRNLIVYHGTNPIELDLEVPLQQWVWFDIFADYGNRQWLLGMDGQTVASSLNFYTNEENPTMAEVALRSGTEATYFDGFHFADNEPGHAPELDADEDGLPDWWEQHYFSGITQANPDQETPSGLTLRQSYVAGVDPSDANDGFAIEPTGGRSFAWERKPGRHYDVYWSPDLSEGSWVRIVENHPGESFVETDPDRLAEPTGFYRLTVRRNP